MGELNQKIQSQNKNQEVQQLNQRMWVKDQEVNALKVQNRHLIAKLEEAEKNTKPTQVWAQQISNEVQNYLKPVVSEISQQSQIAQVQIEKSLTQAFEMIQGTLRGVYQQSQRCQESVNQLSSHSLELEKKVHEQRKADQVFFQEKIFSSMQAFCDRLERQMEARLSVMSNIEVMNIKINEMLSDVQTMKTATSAMSRNSELNRQDFSRMGKDVIENHQKLTEIEIQARNMEEISRDGLQQIQNHRTEFKLLRGEMRGLLEQTQKLNEKLNQLALGNLDSLNDHVESNENGAERGSVQVAAATEALPADPLTLDANHDDLGVILELLRNQKTELKRVAKETEKYLRKVESNETISPEMAHEPLVAAPLQLEPSPQDMK